MGFLGFAVTCFDVLAWPLISLGYPLCASIRAIEVNSNSDMHKLITYWILFSLISLLELAFSKPIEWLPLWPYIKLMTISYLVLPRFDGAYHVYVCLVRPYFHVNPRVLINKFNKLKVLFDEGGNFLAMAEKYVEENGSEALEKLIASKSKGTKPTYDAEEIKTVATSTEKKEAVAAIQVKDPIVVQKDIRAMEQTQKDAAATTESYCSDTVEEIKAAAAKSKGKDHIVVQKDIKAVQQTQTIAAAPTEMKNGEQNVAHAEKKTNAPTTPIAGEGNKLPEVTTSKNIQKEWTCAVCQLKTTCEKNLNSHLQGKKHRAKCEELKTSKQTNRSKGFSSTTVTNSDQAKQEPEKRKSSQVNTCKPSTPNKAGTQMQHSKLWCSICNVTCPGPIDMACHLRGRKHLSQVQDVNGDLFRF